jgi:V/A-type H+/Na+-transporting ATPase subunit C
VTVLRRADFDYGNTRLRARRSELLHDADYEGLLGQDVDALLEVLGDNGNGSAVDGRDTRGLGRLHAVVRFRLGRSLEEMRSFYSGVARDLVDALLARFDVQNVVAVLRARSRAGVPTEDVVAALTPVGWLTEPLAREILRAQELAGVVDQLARTTPDRDQAAVLRAGYSEYERTGDLPALERSILADHAARLAARLESTGPDGATLRQFIRRETDQHNLLVALRLRDAIASGAQGTPPPPETLLTGGSVPVTQLAPLVQTPAPSTIVSALGDCWTGTWRPALEHWESTGDLNALQRTLERGAIADATSLFVHGDPLAVDVPLAFSTAKKVEARNLRLLGEASARGMSQESVRAEMVWQKERS